MGLFFQGSVRLDWTSNMERPHLRPPRMTSLFLDPGVVRRPNMFYGPGKTTEMWFIRCFFDRTGETRRKTHMLLAIQYRCLWAPFPIAAEVVQAQSVRGKWVPIGRICNIRRLCSRFKLLAVLRNLFADEPGIGIVVRTAIRLLWWSIFRVNF